MFWLILSLSFQTHARTVLIQGPQTSQIEYKAMLKSHPSLVSPVQHYLETHPLPANRERLLALFTEAQRDFLSKSNSEAGLKFEAIVQLMTSDDWSRSEREIFLHAFLRLAQMEDDGNKRDSWLRRSLVLSDAGISSDLFPPPLLARRNELERQIAKKDYRLKLLVRGWSEILINGRPCGREDCGALPLAPGKSRVTLLSDQTVPLVRVMELQELENADFIGESWANGQCSNYSLSQDAKNLGSIKVFWGLKCDSENISPTVANDKLKTSDEPLPLFTMAAPKPTRIYQSPWFWAGVGAVVVAIVVATAPKKESKEPTTTYGN